MLSATLQKEFHRGGCIGVIKPELKYIKRHGLLVAHSLSSTSSKKNGVWVQLFNPSPAPISVREDEKVGTSQPVDYPDVVFITEVSTDQRKQMSPEGWKLLTRC